MACLDLPAGPDHLPRKQPSTEPIGYLLVARPRRLAGAHERTFVITNNHFQGQAVENAIEIAHALDGRRQAAPAALLQRYPQLARVADSQGGQGEVFE